MSAAWKALFLLLFALAFPMQLMSSARHSLREESGQLPHVVPTPSPSSPFRLVSFQPVAPHHATPWEIWQTVESVTPDSICAYGWRDLDGSQVALLITRAQKRLVAAAATTAAKAKDRLSWNRLVNATARVLRGNRTPQNVFSDDDLIVSRQHESVATEYAAVSAGEVAADQGEVRRFTRRNALRMAAGSLDKLADALKRLAGHLDRAADQTRDSASPASASGLSRLLVLPAFDGRWL